MTVCRRRASARTLSSIAIVGCLSLVFAVACGGGGDTGTTPTTPTTPTAVPTTVTVALSSAIAIGQTTVATARVLDQNGSVMTATVAWSSSNPGVATVNSVTGTVSGVAVGTTQITATVGAKQGSAAITVTVPVPPGTPSLTLTAAGQSSLFMDSPNFTTALAVTAGSAYLIAVVNTNPSSAIREDFTLTGALVGGTLGQALPLGSVAGRGNQANAEGVSGTVSGKLERGLSDLRAPADNHVAGLETNRRIFAELGNPRAAWAKARREGRRPAAGRAAATGAATAPPPINPIVGAVSKVYVRRIGARSCSAVDSIGARTVAVGQHIIVVADTNTTTWPQGFRPDSSYYQMFADEFDVLTWPHLIDNIGDPLEADSELSGLGKVTVAITPLLNDNTSPDGGGSIVAFVNACDFFPTAASGPNANRSNETEIFYSWVPATKGYSVASWTRALRATAVHELKHLVSYTARLLNDSPAFEEVWLEEGLAQVSSEIWERNFSQAEWKSHATFLQTAACEYSFSNVPCNAAGDKPLNLMGSHLPFFFDYLEQESTSNTAGFGLDTPANYGAAWAFARWATDQFATTESAFIKSLIDEPRFTGLANMSVHTGQTSPLLLVYWNVASAIFQTPTYTASDVRITIPSFNFADIFRVGQTNLTCNGVRCGAFTSSGNPVYPVQPIALAPGAISRAVVNVPGTSASYFLLTSTVTGTQSLQLMSGAGAALSPSSGFRVAVLRVQ